MYSLYWHLPIASTWSNTSDYSQRTKKLFQQEFSNDVYETVPRHKKWGWWKTAALYGIHGVYIPHWDVPLYFAIPIFISVILAVPRSTVQTGLAGLSGTD